MLFEATSAASFPVRLEADYPERLSRLSTFFRLFLSIPIFFVFYLLGQGLIWVYLIAILVRGRPVRWLFDTNVAIQRFTYRAYAYFLLLTDRYPPFDGDSLIRYEVDYPERLSRWRLVIWKTATVIPHLIVLGFVFVGVLVVVFLAWFAVLFTGRYPRGLHGFVSGWLRWLARAGAYWASFTDEFPSFSLSEDVGPAYYSSYVVSAIFGWLILLAWIGGATAIIAWPGQTEEAAVSYQALLLGESSAAVEVSDLEVTLLAAQDSYAFPDGLYVAEEGDRFVLFLVGVVNERDVDLEISERDFRLKDSERHGHDPFVVTIDGLRPPRDVGSGGRELIGVMFEMPAGVEPAELTYSPPFGFKRKVKFILR